MAAPSKKDAQKLGRVLELHKQGMSAREIRDELAKGAAPIGLMTVTRWLKDSSLKPNGGAGRREGRERVDMPAPVRSAVLAAAEAVAAPMPEDGAPLDEVRELRRRHRKVADELGSKISEVGADSPIGLTLLEPWGKVLERAAKLGALEQALVPPIPPNPADDPVSVEAAEELERRFAAAVSAAEETARCIHCGRAPFRMPPREDP